MPKRQKSLEDHVKCYPDALKTKLILLCRIRWVERINALEVTIDLIDTITDTFSEMMENEDRHWNRENTCITQGTSLLMSVDFEFIVNLLITQKVLAYTSGIMTSL